MSQNELEEILEGISLLLNDPDFLKKMGSNGGTSQFFSVLISIVVGLIGFLAGKMISIGHEMKMYWANVLKLLEEISKKIG